MNPGSTLPKLPLEPLLAAGDYNVCSLARTLNVKRSRVQGWKGRGIRVGLADDIAIACGFHPWEVWGDDFYALVDHAVRA